MLILSDDSVIHQMLKLRGLENIICSRQGTTSVDSHTLSPSFSFFLDLLFLPSDTLTCLLYFFCLYSLLAA